jgi:uncharacterized protein (TIGR02265 family)
MAADDANIAIPLSEQKGPQVKGTLVATLMKFLRAQGIEAESILFRLPASDREVLRGLLLPSSWYPASTFLRLQEAIVARVPKEKRTDSLREMGRFSAQTNMGPGGLRRAYIRQGDPHHVLSVVPRIYQTVYSVGKRTYEFTGEQSAVIRGHNTSPHDHCFWVAGWLQRVVELSGGNDVHVVERQCQAAGAPHCEYRVEWK